MADKKGVFLFETYFRVLEQLPAQEAIRTIAAFMDNRIRGTEPPPDLSPIAGSMLDLMIERDKQEERDANTERVRRWRNKGNENEESENDRYTALHERYIALHERYIALQNCYTALHERYISLHGVTSRYTSPSSSPLSPPSLLPPTPPNNTPPLIPPLSPPSLSLVRDRSRDSAGAQPPAPLERENAQGREDAVEDGFAEFWALYPRKQRMEQAKKRWYQLNPDETMTAEICRSVLRWSSSRQWTQEGTRFVPLAEKFIAQKIWKDEPDAPRALGATPGTPGKTGTPVKSGTLDRPPTSFDTQEFFSYAVEKACGKDGAP